MNKLVLNYFNGDELAANVWKSKYAAEGEEIPSQMHRRMAREFARIEANYIEKENDKSNLSIYGKNREDLTEDRIYELFDRFKYIIPQGSVMYGLGRKDVYVSLSNCFFVGEPREDSYAAIMEKDEQLVQLMKRRAGVGIDISSLRPRGTNVTNSAGTSTGAASFMERFSNSTREVGQENRRGALLISIDVRHPDAEEFATKKSDLTKVTGANVSLKLTDEFMEAVKNDEDFIQRFPCDASVLEGFEPEEYNNLIKVPGEKIYLKKIKARELWNTIIKQARDNSEPGLLFWDNVINFGPDGIYDKYRPSGTNPCGEITLASMDSCRLMLINLFSFVDNPYRKDAKINFDKLYRISYENQRLMDDLVDLELEYVRNIINKIKSGNEPKDLIDRELSMWEEIYEVGESGRRTGSGLTALGDMIAGVGLEYDSDEALELVDKVMKTKMQAELDATIDLAKLRGHFKGCDPELEFGVDKSLPANSWYKFVLEEFKEQANEMYKYGRRNVSWSTISGGFTQ